MTAKTKIKAKIINDPKNEQVIIVKDDKPTDVDFIGNELATLSDRLLDLENSMKGIQNSVKKVMGRMGL